MCVVKRKAVRVAGCRMLKASHETPFRLPPDTYGQVRRSAEKLHLALIYQ